MQTQAQAIQSPDLLNLLHVGCGAARPERLPAYFRNAQWREIRLDIDPKVQPDIIGSITNLGGIPDGCMDAIWSSHNLEHLNWHEVPSALAEFRRVLKPDGFALISVPDLRAIARHIVEDDLTGTLYESAAGPITALDVVFGHQASLRNGNHYMAHRTGFTATTLGQALADAGFHEARVHEGSRWDLWAIATMPATSGDLFGRLSGVML
ncbi:class I SAM-dependent methyltransferase [Pseudoduganella namucuonensis]|uniref:Methyltransferase domain-containing protein n=1 Tax=Pseudoduganella namucuonensis TaxID=1035707 RepID=A0A1I7L0E2_9BURK|nr:class I SAM-dependent methyltransferase [Pseudoduganella namucuonensis]SFV03157.1 Methyltransferase domain-containing protein [Pseudoduganella namucuonensis]